MRGVTSSRFISNLSSLVFQPALPMRGVTFGGGGVDVRPLISTRTPHAGSDVLAVLYSARVIFQPALPMRGVTVTLAMVGAVGVFQPALPMRGVTRDRSGDLRAIPFQPALPMRGVTELREELKELIKFQPALPMRGVTQVPGYAGNLDVFQPALPMRGVTAILCANLLPRSTYSANRQTRYTQQARQASLCHTIWCEPHVCHMRASCSHHGPTMPRTLQLRTLASHLHAQSSSHICFQDCRIANYLSPDRSARRARS